MGAVKTPNYITGRKGSRWVHSLQAASAAGAKIVVAETGAAVTFSKTTTVPFQGRPWIDKKGNRYDSYECAPYFPSKKSPVA